MAKVKRVSVSYGNKLKEWQAKRLETCNTCEEKHGDFCGDSKCEKDRIKKKIRQGYSKCKKNKWDVKR